MPPEFDDADAYLDFALAEVLPAAAEIAEAADVFLERGAFDVDQARRYLTACAEAGLALRLHGDQFTEQGAVPLAIELGARSIDHLEATGDEGVAALGEERRRRCAPAGERALPRAPDAAGAGARRSGRDRRPGNRLQPGQRLLRKPAARLLSRGDAAQALAGGSPRRLHGQCRARARRSDSRGRLAPGYDADIVLLEAPDWRYLAYHLGANLVAEVILHGERAELG